MSIPIKNKIIKINYLLLGFLMLHGRYNFMMFTVKNIVKENGFISSCIFLKCLSNLNF